MNHPVCRNNRVPFLIAVLTALLAAIAVTGLARPPAARAADSVDVVSEALRRDRLYVSPDATVPLDSGQLDRIRAAVTSADPPVFLAIVAPLSNDRTQNARQASQLARTLGERIRQPGTYAVLAGTHLTARSSVLATGEADRVAATAARQHPGDVAGGLVAFVTGVDRVAGSRQGGGGRNGTDGATGDGGGAGGFVALGLLAAGLGGTFFWVRGRNRKRLARNRAELAKVRETVDEDITSFGEELDRFAFDPAAPGVDDAMRADFKRALDAYESAKREMEVVRRPEDIRAVTTALEEGRFALACVQARQEGRPLPERRPPCFFDPRHGPSVRDVAWAPPEGGAERMVPACSADATRIEDGMDPLVRTVPTEYGRRPYWDAGPAYAPWAGGYFGGYGSMLLPGLLIGTVLGGTFNSPVVIDTPGGWDNSGDVGGGDFGGGDFGGGDFGGGDFGGGGGGGGDFG